MDADVAAQDVVEGTFWLGGGAAFDAGRMMLMADCIASIRPGLVAASRCHGDRRVIWALTAIVVDAAARRGEAAVAARILRCGVRLLELEAGNAPPPPDPQIGADRSLP
ncbi:hypothetical protein LNKW23_32550 [Paralimibaculum aggregatum]|uniref:Uncharacterized protein n=1 Tax=Paralimibaculum aggregatum TaxID=3036245 RepID=A0ABQ6LNM1_9RHOB|nr:hypothetical protein [Limibaculum sp. NKW23]GMG84041.1 hypothetical protein LNKW23_32550 [Limibaculum sp. NKW23]